MAFLDDLENEIIRLYNDELSYRDISKRLLISAVTVGNRVQKYLKQGKIKPRKRVSKTKINDKEFIEQYHQVSRLRELQEYFPYNYDVIRRKAIQLGLRTKQTKNQSKSKLNKTKAISLYKNHLTIYEISLVLKVHRQTIYRLIKDNIDKKRLKHIPYNSKWPSPEKLREQIVTYKGNLKVLSNRYGLDYNLVKNKIKLMHQEGLLPEYSKYIK